MIIYDQKVMENMLGHLLSTSGIVPDPLESFKIDFEKIEKNFFQSDFEAIFATILA